MKDNKEQKEHYIYKEFEPYLKFCFIPEKTYIEERLINQIIWYDDKAIEKQNKYKKLTIISIVLTATIPLLTLFTRYEYGIIATILITISSATSSTILSIINLCEYHKLWIEYRSTCEILKSILHRYFMKSNEFESLDKKESLNLLISSCEEYMTKEFQTWTQLSHEYKKEQ